jgi:predicted AAA+ superfamily ATPase
MGFLSHIEIWGDVKDPAMDEITAPSLGMLALGRDDRYRIYADPMEFFSRTYLTSDMVDVLEIVARALRGESESKIVLLLSLFGGGKTPHPDHYIPRTQRPRSD